MSELENTAAGVIKVAQPEPAPIELLGREFKNLPYEGCVRALP